MQESETVMESNTSSTGDVLRGYAPVNGVQMYYEMYGSGGRPLVLLHGAFGVTGMFAAILPTLAHTRQVIAVELQAHGHTADIDRPLSFEQMADDVAGLMAHLGLENTDLCGYSLGGGVALQTAIRHPGLVRKLVLISAPCKSSGWYPANLAGMRMVNGEMAKTWVQSPMYAAYASVAPNPEDWPNLADKLGRLLNKDYDWSEGLAAIKAPVLIVVGDADGVRLSHAVEMFELVGGGKMDDPMAPPPASQLAILPSTTHLAILDRSDLLLPVIPAFLDAPLPRAQ